MVPSSYSHQSPGSDHRELVQWARFEQCDVNDICGYTEQMEANGNVAPLVLVIGYTTGVQVRSEVYHRIAGTGGVRGEVYHQWAGTGGVQGRCTTNGQVRARYRVGYTTGKALE